MKYVLYVLAFVMCCINCVAQTYIEPVFDRTDVPSLHINKIEVTKDTTFVYCTYTAEAGSWARISKDTYLYDHDKKKKYTLLKCSGLPFSPQQRDFRFGESAQIIFCFPCIGNAIRLDFVEDPNNAAFNIYGINVKERYESLYKQTDFDHFMNMSSMYGNTKNDSLAIQYMKKEVEAAKYLYGVKSEEYLLSQCGLGLMYANYDDFQNAIEQMILTTDLQADIHGKENGDYAMQLHTLGRLYFDAQNYEKASTILGESIALYESLNIIDNGYALALSFMAYNFDAKGDDEQALYYRGKCLNARRNMGDTNKYLNELYNVAMGIIEDKDIDSSRIQIVENELSSLPDFVDSMSLVFVDIFEKMAFSYTLHEDFNCAIGYCDKALALLKAKGMDNSEKCAEILGTKCRYQRHLYYMREAITTGERSKQMFENLHIKSTNYAWLLSDLAAAYDMIEDYEQAIQLYKRACDIYEEVSDWLSLAENLNYLGNSYQNQYDLEKAEINIQRGLDVLSNYVILGQYVEGVFSEKQRQSSLSILQDRIKRAKAESYSGLTNIYFKKGEIAKAIDAEKESMKILQDMPQDKDLYFFHLASLASLYREERRYDKAIECGKQCLRFWESSHQTDYIAATQANLAYIYYESGDTIQSLEYAQKVVSILRSNDSPLLSDGLGLLSLLYWKSLRYKEAEECLSEALDSIQKKLWQQLTEMTNEQKQRIWNKYKNYFIVYRDLVYKGEKDGLKLSKLYNYVLFSKSMLLDSELFNNDELSARFNITWKDIQNKLADSDIAIEFIATIDEQTDTIQYGVYHALIIDKECKFPEMITLVSEKALIGEHEDIGDLIWQPILTRYKNVRTIYFAADGVWNSVPIENLYVDNIGIISDKYNMYRLSSTKELIRMHKASKIEKAVLYGGLTYSMGEIPDLAVAEEGRTDFLRGIKERGGFDPLYSTFTEVNSISNLLKQNNIHTTLYVDENGTEDSFRKLSGAGVDLIHLATHGMFVDMKDVSQKRNENYFVFLESFMHEKNPVQEDILLTHSFLVMSGGNKTTQREVIQNTSDDGILTAEEISQMKLKGLDLVVLSTCESALGVMTVSDGIFGLQRGFKKAGANTILMSLDNVDDTATTILMIEFYKNLMSGKSKLQSLKDAQKYLRVFDDGKYIDPKYWKPFIMLDGLD